MNIAYFLSNVEARFIIYMLIFLYMWHESKGGIFGRGEEPGGAGDMMFIWTKHNDYVRKWHQPTISYDNYKKLKSENRQFWFGKLLTLY